MEKLPAPRVISPGLLKSVQDRSLDVQDGSLDARDRSPDLQALELALALNEQTGEHVTLVGRTKAQSWYLFAGILIFCLPFAIFSVVTFTQERFCQILVAFIPIVSLLLINYFSNLRSIVVFTNQRVFVILQNGKVRELGTLSDCIINHGDGKTTVRVAEREYVVGMSEKDFQKIACLGK